MTDPFQTILQAGNRQVNNFPLSSRYFKVQTAILVSATGDPVNYLRRRFLPNAGKLEIIQEYVVKEGDRLDNIAAAYIGDPEQFWQIADANNAIKPEGLTENPGYRLSITHPEGFNTF